MSRNITELDNEQKLDAFADILEPVSEIVVDPAARVVFAELSANGKVRAKSLVPLIKGHKREIIEILAVLDGESVETYKISFFTMPIKLMQLLNDPAFVDLFTSQGQTKESPVSGSATANTEDGEQ